MSDVETLQKRKSEHLIVCRDHHVEFRTKTSWFEHVELLHQAAPEFHAAEADLSLEFMGRRLAAPFLFGAMTGGTDEGGEINRALAKIAASRGVGLALGSQRPMIESHVLVETYQVRDVAPDILLLGNIGMAQAAQMAPEEIEDLAREIGADGVCLHLNAAMEMFQKEGDNASSPAAEAVQSAALALGPRLVVKETGCGMARETAYRLADMDVRTIDVAGAGGTSWVRVENLRRGSAPEGLAAFEEWGIPTAASLLEVRDVRVKTIASGGLRSGLDLAKSIALGAELGSAALPALRAWYAGGADAVARWLDGLLAGLRTAMALAGCRDLGALRQAPLVITGPLREWAEERGLRKGTS